jgi:phosphoserine phosphatase
MKHLTVEEFLQKIDYKKVNDKRVVVFDLDDTLIVTDAKIKVIHSKSGKEVASLTPSQFNYFSRKNYHKFNFEEFESQEILNEGKFIRKIFQIFRKMVMNGQEIAIVTARSDKMLVHNFFKEKGIRIMPNMIFAVSKINSEKYHGSIAERKKQALNILINKGYTEFIFFDDNCDNLHLVKELESSNVKVETVHVQNEED